MSGSGLRPARQAPHWRLGPPRGEGRHHQSSPGAGLVDPPPSGQDWLGHRLPVRRPGRRRSRRRPGHPDSRRRAWREQLGAISPDRRRWLASLSGPDRPGQRPPTGSRACRLAGSGRLCGRPTQPPRFRPPYQWVAGRNLNTPLAQVPAPLLERLHRRWIGRSSPSLFRSANGRDLAVGRPRSPRS
jgi:hypothetical protein